MKLRYPLFLGLLALATVFSLKTASLGTGKPADAPAPPPAKDQPAVTFSRDILPFLSKPCFACHGNGKKSAGLTLDRYKDDESLQKDRKVWENVLHMVRTGEMPPRKQ